MIRTEYKLGQTKKLIRKERKERKKKEKINAETKTRNKMRN
jgi:hypothetical protein